VLDIGCATGQLTRSLSKTSEFVVALDLQKIFCRLCSHKLNFINGDALNLPFKDRTFDAVTSFDVIEHLVNAQNLLKEINRVLKPHGRFLITTPNRDRLNLRFLSLISRKAIYPRHMGMDSKVGDVTHIHEYSKSELYQALTQNGFMVDKITGIYVGLVYGFPPKIEIGIGEVPRSLEGFASLLIAIGSKK
jgi:ubiquinone/menaquinone biosynthesis C-methylase UbiE